MTTDALQPGDRSGSLLGAAIRARSIDPLGDRLHLWAAALFLVLNSISAGASSAGFIILTSIAGFRFACSLGWVRQVLRLLSGGRIEVTGISFSILSSLSRQPLVVAILLYLAWLCLSLLWASPSTELGLETIKSHRMLLLPLLLFPVLHHARLLVLAFLAGTLILVLLQLLQYLQWPPFTELTSNGKLLRFGAFNNEIVTGLFLAVSISFWIRWLLIASLPRLAILLPLFFLTCLGMLLTGSRGPILACICAVFLSLLLPYVFVRRMRKRIMLLSVVVSLFLVASIAATWNVLRVENAVRQFEQADQALETSVGYRLLLWEYGIDCFEPLLGTGAGNAGRYLPNEKSGEKLMINGSPYPERKSKFELLQNPVVFKGESPDRLNLHSTYIQALVTLGLPGLALFCWMLVAGLAASWRLVRNGGMAGAALFGMMAWIIAGVFESQQIGGQKLSSLGFLLSLALLGCSSTSPPNDGKGHVEVDQGQ